MKVVDFVVPEGIDDRERPSGGNVYDRCISRELLSLGWLVREHRVSSFWPTPRAGDLKQLTDVLGSLPTGGVVVLDGLTSSAAPEVLLRESARLQLVVLVHMPLSYDAPAPSHAFTQERFALSSARAIISSSCWTKQVLVNRYGFGGTSVHVVPPGVARSGLATGTDSGSMLLSVGAVTPMKGQDVVITALERIRDLGWTFRCVGALDIDSGFAKLLTRRTMENRLFDRIQFPGPLTGESLDAAYRGADLLILASRLESYGMVVTEALAHGLPVIATNVGGVSEALGVACDGTSPGRLVAKDSPTSLADELRAWLTDPSRRQSLRAAAAHRRKSLPTWQEMGVRFDRALNEIIQMNR